MPLSDEQIHRIGSHSEYYPIALAQDRAETEREWQYLAYLAKQSQMLPFLRVEDYEKALRGEKPILDPVRPPIVPERQLTDDRSLSRYVQDVEFANPSAPSLSVKEYLRQVGDESPFLVNP
jgi:hypothetical protein